jgi:hypothetical protein
MKRAIAALILFSSLLGTVAHSEVSAEFKLIAQEMQGTLSVKPMMQYKEGVVDACGFDFTAMAFDYSYKGGDPFILNGSFAVRQYRSETLAIAYKVGTLVWSGDELKPEAPHMAWIKFGKHIFKSKTVSDSDSDGYRLYAVGMSNEFKNIIPVIQKQQEVFVGFNRKDGGLDVVVKLDLNVRETNAVKDKFVRTRDKNLGPEFIACFGELLNVIKK